MALRAAAIDEAHSGQVDGIATGKAKGLCLPFTPAVRNEPTVGEVGWMAERQGFEPWDRLRDQRFSRPPRSTTPAPLQQVGASRYSVRARIVHGVTGNVGAPVRVGGKPGRGASRRGPIQPLPACDQNGREGGIRFARAKRKASCFLVLFAQALIARGFEPLLATSTPSTKLADSRLRTCDQNGGEGGIRTLGRVAPTHDFQSCTFGHSVTSPWIWQ